LDRGAYQRYRAELTQELESLLRERPPHGFDDQALPSYTHPIRLARWLFWQRVRIVIGELEALDPANVLDFGCGAGVLFPWLVGRGATIHACDPDLWAARELARKHGWKGIHWVSDPERMDEIPSGSLDAIIALDVLEHVSSQELERLGARLSRLLKTSGRLVVSGPTESWLYRMGRRVAGFSGHYHERSIYDIEAELSRSFDLKLIARLYWPISLFRVVVGTPT
jgi:2-polyprenyl-3-methyl-5-hydroxy-6-metoxy-1,4-benzoquinol methylase